MKQRIVPLLAAALALTVMLAGCSSQEEAEPLPQGMDTETVLTAGEAVLDRLLEGDYEAVYESFREDIRADLTAQSVQDLVEPVFQEAGDYQELKSAQVTGSTEGEEHGIAQLLCIFSQEKVSIRVAFDLPSGATLLAAIIVLAVMILPSIVSVSETALRAVPREYEEASLALGATHIETVFRVSVPAARSGIATAIVLGIGRAIGEAMAIIMVAGNVANMPGLLTPVRFLTTAIASEMSYASVGSLHRNALFSIGLVLFLFIMLINVFLNVFIKRKKED